MEARAMARYVRVTPRKARRVVDLIRGMPADEAKAVLAFAPQSASDPVGKVLASAVANAEFGGPDSQGHFTLANLLDLFQPSIVSSYLISIKVSAASAIGGALIGFFLAYAAIAGGLPAWVRPTLMTFSGVASNFAGVPLAFAFLATLGRTGSGQLCSSISSGSTSTARGSIS